MSAYVLYLYKQFFSGTIPGTQLVFEINLKSYKVVATFDLSTKFLKLK